MAIPPRQSSVREGAGDKLDLAPFRTGMDFKDRFHLLEPLREGNDSASSIEGPGFAVGEVLVRALSRAHWSFDNSGRHISFTPTSTGIGELC